MTNRFEPSTDDICLRYCGEEAHQSCRLHYGPCMQWWEWRDSGEPKPGTVEWEAFVKTLPADFEHEGM